jgi:hypothetical protein
MEETETNFLQGIILVFEVMEDLPKVIMCPLPDVRK